MFRAQLDFLPPNQTCSFPVFPISTNITLGIYFQSKAQKSSLTSPFFTLCIQSITKSCWFYFQIFQMHSCLSIILYMEAKGISQNANLIMPSFCLKSSNGFPPPFTWQKSKSLTGYEPLILLLPLSQHPIALCHVDSSFSNEPWSLLPLGLCPCSSYNHLAWGHWFIFHIPPRLCKLVPLRFHSNT